jgi:hypothetical protein
MKADPFARLEPDDPYPGALALGQELSADAGVVVGPFALELGRNGRRPGRDVGVIARLFQHRQGHCFLQNGFLQDGFPPRTSASIFGRIQKAPGHWQIVRPN